jgi:rubredoxin
VLGLRFFACDGCGTVYAATDEPRGCDRCGDTRLAELTDALRDDTYFAPAE